MSLVGSIVERTPDATDTTSLTPFPVSADPKTGFPAATHRQVLSHLQSQRVRKSAFRQNREAARPLKDGIPIVLSTRPDTELAESTPELTPIETTPETAPDPNWRSTMEAENARRVAEMSTEEREDELRQLGSKFGDLSELAEVLRRAKDSKPRSVPTSPTIEEITDEESVPPMHPSAPILPVHNPQHRVASPPRPVLSRRGSITGSSRAPSGLSTPAVRFAEVTPRDVFTYPSAPTSPKRAPLGIEPPSAETGEDVPKVQWKGKLDPTSPPDLKLSTGANLPSTGLKPPGIAFPALSPLDNATPEAIRRQYFPNESANNPSLEWIADLPEIPDTPVTSEYAYLGEKAGEAALEQRFNLAGTPIPREVGKEMPVHDGLHHNARTSAGYTLGELLHLARSTAPMQRAMALDALARLTARVGKSLLEAWFPRYLPVPVPAKRREGKKRVPDAKGGAGPDTSAGAGPDTGDAAGLDTDAPAGSDEEDIWLDDEDEDDVDPDEECAAPEKSQVVLPAANLRKLVIESATAALGERGAVGTRAIDLLYAALVIWDHDLPTHNVELTLRTEDNMHVMPSNYTSTQAREPRQDEMNVIDNLSMDVMLGTITRQLAARVLPRSVLGRLLDVLLRLGRQSVSWASAIMEAHGLVAEVMRLFVLSGSPYPGSEDAEDQPDVRAIRLLEVLARSSRHNANKLLDPTDTLLRFVAVLPPSDLPPTLLVATLDLYTTLGRYGLYAHIATTAAASFDALSQYVRTRRDPALTKSWMCLRVVWVACATDPHSTSPPHEILWSQIEGWGWGEDTLSLALDDAEPEVWNALTAWLDGAAVNSVRGGAAERERVVQALKPVFQGGKIRQAIESAVARVGKRELNGAEDDALVLCSALRLDLALLSPGDDSTESLLGLPLGDISKSMDALANNPTWDSFYSWDGSSPYAYSHLTSLALCLGNYLLLARRLGHLEQPAWLKLAFTALRRLNPSCADVAARLVQEIGIAIANEPSMIHLSKYLAKPSWDALMPFLLHDLQPDSEHIVSPLFPSAVSVSHITTQLLPSRPSLRGKSYGLPAPNDWTLQPLDHLLRSGTSPVFRSLPKEWDSDEVDVVRTVLALTSARQTIVRDSFKIPLTCSEVVFGCMRVFMLEHGQPHDDSSSEIFRDQEVERLMAGLLSDVSLGPNPQPKRGGPAQLEVAASRHLAGQPFYQFYTDLVGLYDAVSFAHPLFARVLLPPLSTNYAIDYRRLVWGDYGHILRSIQTEAPDVPDDSIHDWLWPRERDGEMIGWYLKALMKGGVQGFLRFVAVHHVATSLWPEFRMPMDEMTPKDKDRTRMIIGALVHQAGPALFSAVMLYEQDRWNLVPYPACYEGQGLDRERRAQRLEWAVSLCGDRVRSRIEHVYNG